jgi:hypothetical protein
MTLGTKMQYHRLLDGFFVPNPLVLKYRKLLKISLLTDEKLKGKLSLKSLFYQSKDAPKKQLIKIIKEI